MKKGYVTVLFAVFCVLGLGRNARAQQAGDTIIAKVPHEFVAGGVTLPAGTYTVSRLDSAHGSRELKISNRETSASVYLIATIFDDTQSGQSQISFIRLGDNYFLSSIQTPIGTYATHIPRSVIALAQTKDHGTVSSSGTN